MGCAIVLAELIIVGSLASVPLRRQDRDANWVWEAVNGSDASMYLR